MIRVGVKYEGTELLVIVENPNQSYKRGFRSYRPKSGMFGVTPAAEAEAFARAHADANDWTEKFRKAGLPAELVEVMS